ncbi:hypothetical protein OAK75_00130 [Bacteriovoracales bacterium]|nr:hypothetical protein [Bacteriovoracales bacterium]
MRNEHALRYFLLLAIKTERDSFDQKEVDEVTSSLNVTYGPEGYLVSFSKSSLIHEERLPKNFISIWKRGDLSSNDQAVIDKGDLENQKKLKKWVYTVFDKKNNQDKKKNKFNLRDLFILERIILIILILILSNETLVKTSLLGLFFLGDLIKVREQYIHPIICIFISFLFPFTSFISAILLMVTSYLNPDFKIRYKRTLLYFLSLIFSLKFIDLSTLKINFELILLLIISFMQVFISYFRGIHQKPLCLFYCPVVFGLYLDKAIVFPVILVGYCLLVSLKSDFFYFYRKKFSSLI